MFSDHDDDFDYDNKEDIICNKSNAVEKRYDYNKKSGDINNSDYNKNKNNNNNYDKGSGNNKHC